MGKWEKRVGVASMIYDVLASEVNYWMSSMMWERMKRGLAAPVF